MTASPSGPASRADTGSNSRMSGASEAMSPDVT